MRVFEPYRHALESKNLHFDRWTAVIAVAALVAVFLIGALWLGTPLGQDIDLAP